MINGALYPCATSRRENADPYPHAVWNFNL